MRVSNDTGSWSIQEWKSSLFKGHFSFYNDFFFTEEMNRKCLNTSCNKSDIYTRLQFDKSHPRFWHKEKKETFHLNAQCLLRFFFTPQCEQSTARDADWTCSMLCLCEKIWMLHMLEKKMKEKDSTHFNEAVAAACVQRFVWTQSESHHASSGVESPHWSHLSDVNVRWRSKFKPS